MTDKDQGSSEFKSDWHPLWKRINTAGFRALLVIGGCLIAALVVLLIVIPADAGVKATIGAAGIPAILTFVVVVIQAAVAKQMADIMVQQEAEMTLQRKTSEDQRDTMRGQLDAMERQIQQTKDLFEMGQRPSLGIINIERFVYATGKPIEVSFIIKNSGTAPARKVTSRYHLSIYEVNKMAPDTYCPIPVERPMDGISSQGVIPINGQRLLAADISNFVPPAHEVARFNRGELAAFLWARITYENFTGKEFFLEYYGRFDKTGGHRGFMECDSHNDAN